DKTINSTPSILNYKHILLYLSIHQQPTSTLFPTRRSSDLQTGKKFRVGIKSNISTNRNNLISGVDRCIHLNAMKKTTITRLFLRSEERFSRNAETELVCRLLLEKKKGFRADSAFNYRRYSF